jgi:hypothetical protein
MKYFDLSYNQLSGDIMDENGENTGLLGFAAGFE